MKPALLPMKLEGKRLLHVVPHGDYVVVFYGRGGKAEIKRPWLHLLSNCKVVSAALT